MSRARGQALGIWTRRLGGAAVSFILFTASGALGQPTGVTNTEQGPVYGAPQERKWLSFDRWSGQLDLKARYENQEIKNGATGESSKSTQWVFEELLTLQTHGAILHPNFIELDLTGTIGLRQTDFKASGLGTDDLNQSENGLFTAYDATATILRKQMTTFTLYARRHEDVVNRDFGPSLTTTYESYGGIIDIKSTKVPTRIELYHTEQSQDDPSNIQGYRQSQNTALWHSEWIHNTQSRVIFDYSYNSVDEKPDQGPSLKFDTHEATLSHSYNFGKNLDSSLYSSINYMNQTGDQPQDRVRWDENLTLQHTRTLQSFYRYSYTSETRPEIDQSRHLAEIGFDHKLYESLITHGSIGFERFDTAEQDLLQEYFARINFDYTKKIPYGTLGLTLGLHYSTRQSEGQTQPVQIIDDAATFNDPLGIVLTRPNVDPASLVVTNSTGFRHYIQGIDYQVIQLPNRIEIRRIPGGAISNSQPVLLDYTLGPQPANTVDTSAFSLGSRYTLKQGPLKGLAVYARYFHQDQSVSSDVPVDFLVDNIRDFTFGAEYRIGGFTFVAEQEYRDSTISPFDSFRAGVNYHGPLSATLSFNADLNYNLINYKDVDNQVTFLNASGALTYQLGRAWYASLSATYRQQNDALFGDTTGLEEQFQIQWRHRQTLIYGSVRNVNLDVSSQESNFQFFEIGIRRNF